MPAATCGAASTIPRWCARGSRSSRATAPRATECHVARDHPFLAASRNDFPRLVDELGAQHDPRRDIRREGVADARVLDAEGHGDRVSSPDLSRERADTRLLPGAKAVLEYRRRVDRAGLRARVSVVVYPDAFYTVQPERVLSLRLLIADFLPTHCPWPQEFTRDKSNPERSSDRSA